MSKYSAQKLHSTAPSNKLAEKSLELLNHCHHKEINSQVKISNKSINYLNGLEIGLKFPNATGGANFSHVLDITLFIHFTIAQLQSVQLPEGQQFCLQGSANIPENTTWPQRSGPVELQITPLRREYQDRVLGCFVKCTLLSRLSYNKLQINVVIRGLQLNFFFREHLRKTHLPFSDIITKCLQLIDRHFPVAFTWSRHLRNLRNWPSEICLICPFSRIQQKSYKRSLNNHLRQSICQCVNSRY